MAKKPKRTPLTDRQKAAQEKLLKAWESKKKELKLTQESVGGGWGLTQGAVSQYLLGTIALNIKAILRFSKVLQIDPSEIDDDLSTFDDGLESREYLGKADRQDLHSLIENMPPKLLNYARVALRFFVLQDQEIIDQVLKAQKKKT